MTSRVSSGGLRWTVLALACLASTLPLGGCAGRQRAEMTALPTVLRVGIDPIYPPLTSKEGGQLRGIEVDFAQLLGRQLGVEVRLVELPWDDLIPALAADEIDVIMSGMSITAKRFQSIDFTVPYMAVGQMAVVRRVDLPRLRDQDALDQPTSRVGVIQNTTGDFWARRSLKQAKVTGVASVDAGVEALRAEQIDFFISDAPVVWELTSRRKAEENADLGGIYRPLTQEYLAWAVRQGDDILRRQLSTTLLMWEQNGQLEDVIDDWISTRRVTLQMK